VTNFKDFKTWLKEELDHRGWTYRDLEKHAGVSRTMTGFVINGQRPASWDYCAAIARAFNYSPIRVFLIAGLLTFDDLPFPSRLMETRNYKNEEEN